MKKIALIVASAALATTPVLAETNRATAPVAGESQLGGGEGSGGIIAALLTAGILAILAFAITDDNGDDDPVSA